MVARSVIHMFEGTDGVGKSSAAAHLARQLGNVPIVHFGPPPFDVDPLIEYVRPIVHALVRGRGEVVLDRSPFGSAVWSTMGFHPPTMDREFFSKLGEFLGMFGSKLSIVFRSEAGIESELLARTGDEAAPSIANSLAAQRVYFDLVLSRRILYIPVQLVSSDLLHHIREAHHSGN